MQVLLTGASGQVGRFIANRLYHDGHDLTFLGRTPPNGLTGTFQLWDLSEDPMMLPEADALIHCALAHEAGKYRGGEGNDPGSFVELNSDGTRRLFDAAKAKGTARCIFLSSRAVYSDVAEQCLLTEVSDTRPSSLYGQVKLDGERALEALCDGNFRGSVLRATGIYGCPPGLHSNKWSQLFQSFERGEMVSPRAGTEVHGEDLASAVALILGERARENSEFEVFNVSDILLDRQDLLQLYAQTMSVSGRLPARSEVPIGVMQTSKLEKLGWRPGGQERLKKFVDELLQYRQIENGGSDAPAAKNDL